MNLKAAIFLLVLLAVFDVHASNREFELFDRGYEHYLAYQPQKAVEEFRTFLREFPKSSSADAAMFWLGKALVQLNSLEEAKMVFLDIKKKFSQSPFIGYAEKEFERINSSQAEVKKAGMSGEDAKREKDVAGEKLMEPEKKINIAEADLLKSIEERDKLKLLLVEEKKKTTELQEGIGECEKKIAYMINSSFVLKKLGVKDALWRSGNVLDDYVSEQMLYHKAKSLNISTDMKNYKDIVEKYKLNNEQADYLQKFLTISDLINRKLQDMQEEKVVELLDVKYGSFDKYTKIVVSTELQKLAKSGMSFEEIHTLYPDVVKLSSVGFQDLEAWVKEKIQSLSIGDIGVIWSEGGYVILKPGLRKLSFKPFEEVRPEIKNKIKVFVEEWLNERKGKTDEIEIRRLK